MATKLLFLVSAQMQAGKNVFGAALARATRGYSLAFADPVKEVAIALVGMPSSVAYGGEEERRAWKRYCRDQATCKNEKHDACTDAREWLQWIGTELGRVQIHEDVWVHRLLERVRGYAVGAFILTDTRFDNELFSPYDSAEWMTRIAAFVGENYPHVFEPVLIRLKRPGHENKDPHPSESAQLEIPDDKFDYVVVNQSTTSALEAQAALIAKNYIAR